MERTHRANIVMSTVVLAAGGMLSLLLSTPVSAFTAAAFVMGFWAGRESQ